MSAIVRPGGKPGERTKRSTRVLRDFSKGVNLSSPREAIADDELWWCEGAIPLGPGNLQVMNGPQQWSTSIVGETGVPSYVMTFTVGVASYIFAVWSNSGNGWIGSPGGAFTKYFSGTLAGTTSAAPWNNQGILVVNSASGYYDWNVTSANTVTSLSNSVQSITLTNPGAGYTSVPNVAISGGGGSGALAGCTLALASAAIQAAGTGYVVGDLLGISTTLGSAGTFTVTTIGAGGAITGISAITRGSAIGSTIANPVAATGGTGTGATFNCTYNITNLTLSARGSGYTSTPTVTFTGGAPVTGAAATVTISGSLTGTSIATYAGRAWIASGRTVTFTDAGSYASFVGSGSQFTIEDQYLLANITALYVANNYLYIFGDTSIDVLSNVTVTAAGTANFSRVNVSASVGTSEPNSIFSYYRSVAFANSTGFYLLSGATPENISENLALLIQQIDFSVSIYGGCVTINGKLCAAFLFTFTDIFVGAGSSRQMLAIFFGGKWTFSSQWFSGSALAIKAMASVPETFNGAPGTYLLWAFDSTAAHVNELFAVSPTTAGVLRIRTKTYDFGDPIVTKQAIRGGIGMTMATSSSLSTFDMTVDTEQGTGAAVGLGTLYPSTYSGYQMFLASITSPNNGKYVGFGLNEADGSTNVQRVQWLAMECEETNEWQ